MGMNVAEDAEICDLEVFGGFVPVDERTSVSSLYVPKPSEKSFNLICHALAPFEFFGTLMMCRYYWAFPVLGYMAALSPPGCNVRLPVTWLMNSQSSLTGRTRVLV